MAKKSVIGLHVEVSANGSKTVNEFGKIERASKQMSNTLREDIRVTMSSMARDFTPSKLAKGLFAGFGMGGGMQLASFTIEKIVGLFKMASEHAAELEERAKGVDEAMRSARKSWGDMSKGLMPDERKRDVANQDIASISAQIDEQVAIREKAFRGMNFAKENDGFLTKIQKFEGDFFTSDGTKQGTAMPVAKFFDVMLERAEAAQKKIAELQKEFGPLVADVVSLNDKMAGEKIKTDTAQAQLRVQEINLGAGRSAAEVRGAITGDETQAGLAAVGQMNDERARNASNYLGRLEQSSRIRVDDMTRRGMGTGADYKNVQQQSVNVLKEIRDIIRRLEGKGLPALMGD